VKTTLQALLPVLEEKNDSSHLDKSIKHYQTTRKGLDDLATGSPGVKPIHPQYVAKVLDEVAARPPFGPRAILR
jgi:pyruvate dehydrogenase (quinone)